MMDPGLYLLYKQDILRAIPESHENHIRDADDGENIQVPPEFPLHIFLQWKMCGASAVESFIILTRVIDCAVPA